jgi:hypothetical protein
MPATNCLLCMGLFSIFWVGRVLPSGYSRPQSAFALRASARQPSLASLGCVARACLAEAREASEGWWARQDSNLQPDRCEGHNIDRVRCFYCGFVRVCRVSFRLFLV